MNAYAYYPGCSLSESAREYDVSTRAVMGLLGAGLEEIPDWTCCGAGAVESVSLLMTYALPARNMSLSHEAIPGADMLIPCSACYLNHLKAYRRLAEDSRLRDQVNTILATEGRKVSLTPKPRHLLDVLVNDISLDAVAAVARQASLPLRGLKLAPYYGCQILRPYPVFDDPERPQSMHNVLRALGAEPLDWHSAGHCCGASLMAAKKKAALDAVAGILGEAMDLGAEAVGTGCPMCQMNLEAYQAAASRRSGRKLALSVVYLPQLMGLAMGLSAGEVLLGKNLCISREFKSRIQTAQENVPLEEAGA